MYKIGFLNSRLYKNMVYKACIFAFSVAFLAAVSCRPTEESICKGKSDGVYGHPLNGKFFYICTEESPFLRISCGKGEIFEETLKSCLRDRKIKDSINYNEDYSDGLFREDINSQPLKIVRKSESSPLWKEDAIRGISKYKIYNIKLQENIFPKSLLFIGKSNREQKNV